MTDEFRVLLLTDLRHSVAADSVDGSSVFAYELALALKELGEQTGGISVDWIVAKGSDEVLPSIRVDPNELGVLSADQSWDRSWLDALYTQMFLSGITKGYTIVHSLAPILSPLQLLNSMGLPFCQTVITSPVDPVMKVQRTLFASSRFCQIGIGFRKEDPMLETAPPLPAQKIVKEADGGFLLWDGVGGDESRRAVMEIARASSMSVRELGRNAGVSDLGAAAVFCQLAQEPDAAQLTLSVRALSAGIPLISWPNLELEVLLADPSHGAIVPVGDIQGAAMAVARLVDSRRGIEWADFGWCIPRGIASRYREIYKTLLKESDSL